MRNDNDIEKILASLDNLSRASAPEEFRGELFQKISFLKNRRDPWLRVLKYAVAAMIALAVINGYVLFENDLLNTSDEAQIEVLANDWYYESDLIEYNYDAE